MDGLNTSIIGRAIEAGLLEINAVNIRDYSTNKHMKVDDYPYGGGAGLVMQPEPVYRAYKDLEKDMKKKPRVVYLTPQGTTFHQEMAKELAKEEELVFLCGHYEGIDERVIEEIVTDPVSIGDYVLTGGELPAMVMIDAISRMVPGVLKNEDSGETELYFDGPISEESWLNDEITPAKFKEELAHHAGDLTVWLNSPGGDVLAASQIYTMLKNHKGRITVKIDALAASAASVVAMAGDKTLISPTGMIMCHNPATLAMGNKADMEKAIELLEEVKESIINAYEAKTGLSRSKISKMMDDETWMNAKKALKLGFVDGILFAKQDESEPEEEKEPEKNSDSAEMLYTPSVTAASFLQKLTAMQPTGVPINQLEKRLSLLRN